MTLRLVDQPNLADQRSAELTRALEWGREVRAAGHGPSGVAVERALFVAQFGIDAEASKQFEAGLSGF